LGFYSNYSFNILWNFPIENKAIPDESVSKLMNFSWLSNCSAGTDTIKKTVPYSINLEI
jgi:hypothetical protein